MPFRDILMRKKLNNVLIKYTNVSLEAHYSALTLISAIRG